MPDADIRTVDHYGQQLEVFVFATHEDADAEVATKVVATLRKFGEEELAGEIEAAAERDPGSGEMSDLLDEALHERLPQLCPENLRFGFLEDIDGYAFWPAKEGYQQWQQFARELEDYLASTD